MWMRYFGVCEGGGKKNRPSGVFSYTWYKIGLLQSGWERTQIITKNVFRQNFCDVERLDAYGVMLSRKPANVASSLWATP